MLLIGFTPLNFWVSFPALLMNLLLPWDLKWHMVLASLLCTFFNYEILNPQVSAFLSTSNTNFCFLSPLRLPQALLSSCFSAVFCSAPQPPALQWLQIGKSFGEKRSVELTSVSFLLSEILVPQILAVSITGSLVTSNMFW